MRAKLINAWPGLSHWFGIKPWHVERMTFAEINAYIEALNDIRRDQQKQQAAAKRGRR